MILCITKYILLFFILLMNCQEIGIVAKVTKNQEIGEWDKKGLHNIIITPNISIGSEKEDERFGNLIKVQIDNNKNIYVLDITKYRIQKFDSSGKFLFSIGNKEKFKGYLNFYIGKSTNKIYIVDLALKRVNIFNTTGTFLRFFDVPLNPYKVIEAPGGNILVIGQKFGEELKGEVFHLYDSIGKHIKSFGNPGPQIQNDVRPFVPTAIFGEDGTLYSFDENKYEIYKYDKTGKIVLRIVKDSPSPKIYRPPTGKGYYKMWGSAYLDILKDGKIVNLFGYMENNVRKDYFDLFDRNGKLLSSYDFTQLGIGLMIDGDNQELFVWNGESIPKITRCSFKILNDTVP